MQTNQSSHNLADHNRVQRGYFENTVKHTMIPIDTPYNRRQVEELLRFADYKAGERILDVGCGMGRHVLLMAKLGVNIEGLDLSPVLLEQLRVASAGEFEIPLYCADIHNPPEELKNCYDAVVGFFTLHHLYDLNTSFKAMVNFLKPGGRIVFMEPNPLNVLFHIQILITPGMSYQGERLMPRMRPQIVFPAMQQAGLAHTRLSRFGFFPPFIANRTWGISLGRILERFPLFHPVLPFQLFRGDLE